MSVENYGDYQLIKKLASGGMASIFLARQKGFEGFEKLLVVKRILPHLAENEDFIKMFLDEARIAARLNHPNIVQIYNLGAQDESYFIAMEYIHGEDVRRLWKKSDTQHKPIPIPLVCRIVMDAAAGLDYAHHRTDAQGRPLGIVHRDVSPQNILVTFDGGVKVVDFGIAKAADQASVTQSGVLKGKYSYMSPEQAAGQKIDRRSDIFALGVVLYELLTGTRLFKRTNDLDTLNAVAECRVIAPSEVNERVPKDLDPIVMKALTKSPAERYPDASALQAALELWLLTNKLPSSAVHLATFIRDVYADRLRREAEEGRVLVEEVDRSRNPDEQNAKGPPARSPIPVRAPLLPPEAGQGPTASGTEDPELTRADRSSSKERQMPPPPSERERVTGRTASAFTITETARKRFPWLWVGLLAAVGAGLGALAVGHFTRPQAVIRVVSDPPGATVTLDGAPLPGLFTPCALPGRAPGNHRLRLELAGHQPLETVVDFPRAGDTTLRPFRLVAVDGPPPAPLAPTAAEAPPAALLTPQQPLQPTQVAFTIKSTPPGATAWVDGRKVGSTPCTTELDAGTHAALKLELAGYRDVEATIHASVESPQASFNLEKGKRAGATAPKYGTVRFKVDPWAAVECGDLKLGNTPLPDRQLPVGLYRCVFTNPDFKERRVEVLRVEANTLTKVRVVFQP